jgi:hypothetical protein
LYSISSRSLICLSDGVTGWFNTGWLTKKFSAYSMACSMLNVPAGWCSNCSFSLLLLLLFFFSHLFSISNF